MSPGEGAGSSSSVLRCVVPTSPENEPPPLKIQLHPAPHMAGQRSSALTLTCLVPEHMPRSGEVPKRCTCLPLLMPRLNLAPLTQPCLVSALLVLS